MRTAQGSIHTFSPLDPGPTHCTELYTHTLSATSHTLDQPCSLHATLEGAQDHPPAVPAPPACQTPFCACPHRRRSPPVHPNPASSKNKHTLCILIVRTHWPGMGLTSSVLKTHTRGTLRKTAAPPPRTPKTTLVSLLQVSWVQRPAHPGKSPHTHTHRHPPTSTATHRWRQATATASPQPRPPEDSPPTSLTAQGSAAPKPQNPAGV